MRRSPPSGRGTASERLLKEIRAWMREKANLRWAQNAARFFKEPPAVYGLPTGLIRSRALETGERLKAEGGLPLALELGDRLYASGNLEEAIFAQEVLRRFRRQIDRSIWKRFNNWLRCVNNWASCDGLSIYLVGDYILRNGVPINELLLWARSASRWRRRAAAASLVPAARRGLYREAIFRVADALLPVRDDMVEKGVGWLLKEATRPRQQAAEVVKYLLRNRGKASRLTLRYACERLSAKQKRAVLG